LGLLLQEVYMNDQKWSEPERKIARLVFDMALRKELADIIENFKSQAANVKTPDELWAVKEFLENTSRVLKKPV